MERRGDGYPAVRVGDRVAVVPIPCGQCELCLGGNGHICEKKGLYGVDSDGGLARYARVALTAAHPLPEWASFEAGVLVEPLAVAVRAVRIGRLAFGESAVVIGGGSIGLRTAMVARVAGARAVFLVERQPFRKQTATSLGFRCWRRRRLPASAADRRPAGASTWYSTRRASRRPRARAWGWRNGPAGSWSRPCTRSRCPWTSSPWVRRDRDPGLLHVHAGRLREGVGLVAEKQLDLLPLVSHRLPLTEGIGAIEQLAKGMDAQKVLLAVS